MNQPPATSPKEFPSIIEAKLKVQNTTKAFADVFGAKESLRSPSQKIVLDALRYASYEGECSYQFNSPRDGIALIAAGLHRDGAKFLFSVIEKQLAAATSLKEPVKPKTRK